jgi:hypothetical protein
MPTGLADGLAIWSETATAGTPTDSPRRLGLPARRVLGAQRLGYVGRDYRLDRSRRQGIFRA